MKKEAADNYHHGGSRHQKAGGIDTTGMSEAEKAAANRARITREKDKVRKPRVQKGTNPEWYMTGRVRRNS